MKKLLVSPLFTHAFILTNIAQTDAGLYRYPDVSATQIVFTNANDLLDHAKRRWHR